MRAGKLDRKIAIERRTDTRDAHGEPIAAWNRIGATRWASYQAVDRLAERTEMFAARQFRGEEQIEFTVRYATDLADLSPKDRVVYPPATSPADWQIYEIVAVHEEGRLRGISILTIRRSET